MERSRIQSRSCLSSSATAALAVGQLVIILAVIVIRIAIVVIIIIIVVVVVVMRSSPRRLCLRRRRLVERIFQRNQLERWRLDDDERRCRSFVCCLFVWTKYKNNAPTNYLQTEGSTGSSGGTGSNDFPLT
jgi:hypothetical protein